MIFQLTKKYSCEPVDTQFAIAGAIPAGNKSVSLTSAPLSDSAFLQLLLAQPALSMLTNDHVLFSRGSLFGPLLSYIALNFREESHSRYRSKLTFS